MTQALPRVRPGSILIGMLAGIIYGGVARALDATLESSGLASYDVYHRIFDWVTPALFGLVAGSAVSYAQYRSAKAEWADRRAEELRQRLAGTEQNQAVWVLASSLLHELRNPLHTLSLAVSELSKSVNDASTTVLVREAEAAAASMRGKFDRLRELASGPSADRRRYRLDQLLQELKEQLEPIANRSGVELDVACEKVELDGDTTLTRTILENLTSNAMDSIVSSGVGGKVEVRVTTGAETRIAVRDDGPGLSDELRRTVFEPLSSTKKPNHGLGLGLAIARALARASGGDVQLTRAERGCTIFEVRLPGSRQAT